MFAPSKHWFDEPFHYPLQNMACFVLENAKFPGLFQKKYSIPLKGNIQYCSPVLDVKLNPTMKPLLLAKKHLSIISSFPWEHVMFFQPAIPLQIMEEPSKRCSIPFEKGNLSSYDIVSLQICNIPVPYAACFSICNHCLNLQSSSSCQKVQCINTMLWKIL